MATGSCTSTRPGLDRPATTPGCCVLVAAQAKPVDDGAYSASVRDGPANRMSTLGSLNLARARGRAAEVVPLEAVSPSSAHFRFVLDGARAEMSGERKLTTAVSMAAGSVWYSYMQRWACTCNAGGCVAHVKARGPAKDRHRHAGRVSTGSMDQRPPGASPRGQKRKSGHGGESDEGACKIGRAHV